MRKTITVDVPRVEALSLLELEIPRGIRIFSVEDSDGNNWFRTYDAWVTITRHDNPKLIVRVTTGLLSRTVKIAKIKIVPEAEDEN